MSKKKVLIVGGSGYLGQHLLQAFSEIHGIPYHLAFTHHSSPPQPLLQSIPHLHPFHVDLKTGHGFDVVSHNFGLPDIVVNCVAMSINVPTSLVNWLSSLEENNTNTLLIHLSTDQVYEGVKSFCKEEGKAVPVNVYGKSKIAAEEFISKKFPNFAIFRSSIIFGPQTICPVPKSLPGTHKWIDSVLSKETQVDFFHDEFRCPVYVKDLVTIILALTNKFLSEGKEMKLVLNVGGPDQVSRVQMAEAVADIRGYNPSLIKSVSASSVDRGVKSPADISMDISKLVRVLSIHPVPFKEGVKLTLETVSKP